MNARILSSAAMFAALIFLASCFPDYFPRRKLKVNLSPADIAGEWHLRKDSAKMLQRYRVVVTEADSFVEFLADGRCELHKFVDEEQALSGPGSWKLEKDPLEKDVSVIHIAYRTAERSFVSSLYFTRSHGKVVLWQYHSDPDGREYVEYERQG